MTDQTSNPSRFAAEEITAGVYRIDLGFQGTAGVIAAYLLVGGDDIALIETGPTSTRANLEAGLWEVGYALSEVTRLIPTHIHLDHAGAVGTLMRDFPRMRLSVHAGGAPFLIDPERLLNSAERIYGAQMDELWGEVVGAPADRVDGLADGERITVAGRTLLVKSTPGHAGTHLAYLDEATGTLFTGDAAGARIAPLASVLPTVSPPEVDLAAWTTTVEVMRALRPERLALTHFGVFDDVQAHLEQVVTNAERELELVRQVLTTGGSPDEATEMILAEERAIVDLEADGGVLLARMERAMPAWLATLGLARVLRKAGEIE